MKTSLFIISFVAVVATALAARSFPTHFHHQSVNDADLIRSINENPDVLWSAWPSYRFQNSTLADAAGLCGALPNPEHLKAKFPVKRVAPEAVSDIPESFDSRTAFKGCEAVISLIRDQAACGSCWAVAAAKVFTARRCISSEGKNTMELSAGDLMSCCDECGNGCEGGFPLSAMNYFTETGIVTGGQWNSNVGCEPYPLQSCDHHVKGKLQPCGSVGPTPPCTKKCEASYSVSYKNDKKLGSNAYQVSSSVEDIQREIMTNGPVEAAFSVYADFPTYRSGVYHHVSGDMLGGHAVTIIGWGVEDGTPYWLVENSWNADWGNGGTFNIKRGSDECGIESSIVALKV